MPQTTTSLASVFGVGRGVDVIVYISLALLFYIVFRMFVMIEDLRHEITNLIRQIALQNTPDKQSFSANKNKEKPKKK